MRTALVAGSTGLIGGELIDMLVQSDRYSVVKAITRREIAKKHPKLRRLFISFPNLEKNVSEIAADDVFCCLGTTMAKAGSKEKFREVDFDFPLMLARTALAAGAKQFLLVSALGAKKNASIFYNRVKGELEESISQVGYERLHIFRPSLLLGPRNEVRSAEDAAKFFYRALAWLIPDKYKAIDAKKVAHAMLYFASQDQKGTFIHESAELQALYQQE